MVRLRLPRTSWGSLIVDTSLATRPTASRSPGCLRHWALLSAIPAHGDQRVLDHGLPVLKRCDDRGRGVV